MKLISSIHRWALIIPLLVSVVSPAFSQSSARLFSVSGTVQDPNHAVIAGARVELKTGTISVQSALTDESGGFRFDKVAAGVYQIHISSEGFDPADVPLEVKDKPPALLRISLAVTGVRQETTVAADGMQVSTEIGDNQNSNTISGDTLSNLPAFDQDYVATMSRFLDAGAVGTNGATLVVDGMEVNSLGVSASAIKEVKINNDPYSAEFSRPGRGRIEVITKSGSTEYHGTFNFLFRDYHLNARDPFALTRPPEQRRIYEGILTGPIRGSKKTSFLLSIDRNEEDLEAVVFALGPAGIIQENVAAPARNLLIAGKINHAFSNTHSFSAFYSYQDRSNRNQGVGGIVLPEAGTDTEFIEHEIRISDQSFFSPKLLNQFRFLLGHYSAPIRNVSPATRLVVADTFIGGGAQANQLRTEYHFELTDIVSYTSGRNTIKGGIDIPDFSRRGLDNNINMGGTFYFSSLADYLAQRPFSFQQQQGIGRMVFYEKILNLFAQDDLRLRPNLMISVGLRRDWQNYFHDSNNFAPRFSFAYAPRAGGKTVVRGGAGFFYDRTGPRPIFDILQFNGERLRLYVLPDPGFPDPLGGGGSLAAQPVSVTRLDPNVHIPYTLQYSVGVERQLQKSTTLAITYIGSRGVSLFRSRDLNAPPLPDYLARPNPDFGVIRQIESSGSSRSNSFEVSLRGRASHFLNVMAQYTLSRTYNDTSGITLFPANDYDLSGEWARADFDRLHRFEFLGALNPGKLLNLGVAVSAYSGAPYTLTTGRDDFHTGIANARPAGVRRNSLQGPGYFDLDLRWSHDFLLNKTKKDKSPAVTVGVDAFNVLNRVNEVSFVGNLSSPFFGRAIAAQPPRRLQLSFRFKF
ncbi:MAG TPA: carboxypeptidase regulatory-like domain-containing protein [Blastocatellia bacterium]|nr:carboxypeptidase regulatory-like domain-containing protein [Blastocatellia bacterium]